jgi:cytochrome c oxidase subunit 2
MIARTATALGSAAMAMAISGQAFAQEQILGEPKPDQIGLQSPATSIAVELDFLHNWILMPIITVITIFVMILLLILIFRFNEKRNPVASKTTHNTLIEILWTVIPICILVVIAVPSFRLLYNQLDIPKPDLTIKAIGHQWYWSYEYPDNGNFTFDAHLVTADPAEAAQKHVIRLLDTDNEVVLPVGKNIRVQVTGADVIHSWTVPAFGIKHDGVPGRINESWFNIDKPGIYYGQCSELCGVQHGYMPIKVRAVSLEEFNAWVKDAQTKFDKVETPAASNEPIPASSGATTKVAQAAAVNTSLQPAN